MKNFINKKYLNRTILENISSDFNSRDPVSYYIFDNFIKPEIYNLVELELSLIKEFKIIDKRQNHFINNKTLLLNSDNFFKLYNFFISEDFENFLQIIYKKELKKYRKITSDFLEEKTWIKNSWVVQIYEKWDFMWWHTDIAKDMEREELFEKWWYAEWDKCIVTEFDEVWAFIYYIYNSDNNWDSNKWWVLEIWKIEGNQILPYKEILPLRNRLVIIKSSNKSYHRVTEVLSSLDFRVTIQDLLFKKHVQIWKEIMY